MTSNMNAIEVSNLSKSYIISHQTKRRARSLKELFSKKPDLIEEIDDPAPNIEEQKQETFWALKDISFEIKEGERIAIIGANGAGKSTLLKILSRITEPTSGKITIRGKVASLLEVGTGFHPELTGRENIYLNGAILGMKKREIAAKFDQIVSFSGVEKFIDTPVKFYSSGMYVRLAFSVSAWLDPDILIVDEVLSVGDQAFQRRCAERMKELTGAGRTVLFVSHSMQAVKAMCDKALFLEKGKAASFQSVEDAATQYMRSIETETAEEWIRSQFRPGDLGIVARSDLDDKIKCVKAAVINSDNELCGLIPIEEPFFLELTYEVLSDLDYIATPNIHFYDEFGARFFISLPEKPSPQKKGIYTARCEVPPYLFNVGRYTVVIAFSSYSLTAPLHFSYENALRIEVVEENLVDPRRHGWTGALPGISRYRLDWSYRDRS